MKGEVHLLIALLLSGLPALAAEEPQFELIQPVASERRLVLKTSLGRAAIESSSQELQRISVAETTLLTAVEETHDGWIAAGIDLDPEHRDLILIQDSGAAFQTVAAPSPKLQATRLRPTLMMSHGQLSSLAWLEGADARALAVRFSQREGDGWGDISLVAPPAKGSQTGLTGTVLSDGMGLLVWSAFDGTDDELVWSLGRDNDWSNPRRVDNGNRVPDISPTLIATDRGALLVWNRLHRGHYRLFLARFRGDAWGTPKLIGPAGSLEPLFHVVDDRLHLIYLHASPTAWSVLEVKPSGETGQWSLFLVESDKRPVVLNSDRETIQLRWPGGVERQVSWEPVR